MEDQRAVTVETHERPRAGLEVSEAPAPSIGTDTVRAVR